MVLIFALAVLAIGVVGLISPETLMTLRQQYMVTLSAMSIVGALRIGLGLLLMLVARDSRLPRAIRALGVLVCAQGAIQLIAAPLVGVERAQTILEWEAMHSGLLRAGALIALAVGGFIVYGVGFGPAKAGHYD
jgi:hypothetical protein